MYLYQPDHPYKYAWILWLFSDFFITFIDTLRLIFPLFLSISSLFQLSDLNHNGRVALAHFDHYYSEAYGPVAWRSMRIALLMPSKKAILYNRYFPNVSETISSSYNNDDNQSFLPNINFMQTLIKYQNSLTNNVFNADKNPNIIDKVTCLLDCLFSRKNFF